MLLPVNRKSPVAKSATPAKRVARASTDDGHGLLSLNKPTWRRDPGANTPEELHELGAGRALSSRSRSKFERSYGASFSDVRIHTDTAANGVANRINARAFTYGNHIGFARGQYCPGSIVGDVLLAHELAHVQQQRDATDVASNSESAGLERDADRAAVGAIAGLESELAKPQLKTGLRLSRCLCNPKTAKDNPNKELLPYLEVAAEHVDGLDDVFMALKDPYVLNQLANHDLATTQGFGGGLAGGHFQIDPRLFEDDFTIQVPKPGGDEGETVEKTIYNSDLMRGVVLLHEVLHEHHNPHDPSTAEGQGWGLEIAFYDNFMKETEVWDKLSEKQRASIEDRVEVGKKHPNWYANDLTTAQTAVLFLILLHHARGLDHPREIEEQVADLSADEAKQAILMFMKYGIDFSSEDSAAAMLEAYKGKLDADEGETLSAAAVQLLKWVSAQPEGHLWTLRDEMNALPGPKAKAQAEAEAGAEAERVAGLHQAFAAEQSSNWGDYTDFMTEITKDQSDEFYRYFTPREGRKKTPRLRVKKLSPKKHRKSKQKTQFVFESVGNKRGDIVMNALSIAYIQNHYPKVGYTHGHDYLAGAFERFRTDGFVKQKLSDQDVGFMY